MASARAGAVPNGGKFGLCRVGRSSHRHIGAWSIPVQIQLVEAQSDNRLANLSRPVGSRDRNRAGLSIVHRIRCRRRAAIVTLRSRENAQLLEGDGTVCGQCAHAGCAARFAARRLLSDALHMGICGHRRFRGRPI